MAASAAYGRRDLVSFDKLCRPFWVVRHLRGPPIQVRDLIEGTDAGLGIAVTVQTKTHAERLGVLHHIHLVDLAVALVARNTTVHVNGVIEINEVRHLMDALPGNRIA